jgi:hypothetical protein
MTFPNSDLLASMERLRAQIDVLRAALATSARLVEARSLDLLLAETPVADHAYRRARGEYQRIRTSMLAQEARLGGLILEMEARDAPQAREPA